MSDVASDFEGIFGAPAEVRASAPGRVNLIGEHTDYNGGYVLPMATPQVTTVELRVRDDRRVVVHSANMGVDGDRESYRLGEEQKRDGWIDYVEGVTAVLGRSGAHLPGFDARIDSSLPTASGLSSSAALSVALLRALREALELPIDDLEIALLGQRAETDFVGAPVGVMDPMAASLGSQGEALFIDTRSLAHEAVPFPSSAALVVVSSGISHDNAGPEYRTRREECARAAGILGVSQLRDLSVEDLRRAEALPDPLPRRVRHVVTEDDRVLGAVAAMGSGDVASLGRLFSASHASMRDDYEVSLPEIDALVEIAERAHGCLGARLTGGGFGGCVIALFRRGGEQAEGERIAAEYSARTGRKGLVVIPTRGDRPRSDRH